MDSHNISVCVAPSIFHKLDRPSDVESSFQAIAFIEYLINNCGQLFGSDLFFLLNAAKLMKKKDEPITSSLSSFSSEKNLIAEPSLLLSKQQIHPPTTPTTTTNTEDKTKQNKPIKHKREIGRMLNLVSLKGRKSLSSNTTKLNNEKPNNITTTPELETQVQQQIENESKHAILVNSSIENLTNDEPTTTTTTTGSKLRRRTSTNNSNDRDCFEFNNDEEDEDYDENIFDFNENKNDDDDYEEEEECFSDLISHQYSRRKSNHKRNINSIKIKYKPNNNLNNAVINKQHDLSSNTLSVDSGLSVPTATNSDPESEKSAKICDSEKLKKEIENYFVSNEYKNDDTLTINTSQLTQNNNNNNNLLKRQRRMLALKIDSDETNNNESTDNFEEIQFTYDSNSKPIAPVAPNTNTNDNNNHVLIPYNTDTLPLHYHKNLEQDQENEIIINSFNNKKRIAPTVHDLINQSSVLTLSKLDNFDNLITSNMTLNKSTSTTTTTDLKIKSKTNNKTLVKIDFLLNNLNKNNINNAINTGIGLVKMNEIDFFSRNDKPWV
jgi:hypothetical protein